MPKWKGALAAFLDTSLLNYSETLTPTLKSLCVLLSIGLSKSNLKILPKSMRLIFAKSGHLVAPSIPVLALN